ncbi:MAG: restriction endonuclease subunit S [Kiritimatiellae bacterium]|nr:restriction endonuclease subunit S [Kiritimatiellia bacterium]
MTETSWKTAKLDELGFVGRGKSRHRPRNAAFLYDGPYPFFQTGDIKAANFYLTEYTQTYSKIGLAQSKLWKPGTLCITIAANIAESAILGIEGCFPDSVVGFVADPAKADVRFVKYYIDILKLQMQSVSRGTTQDNLSVDKLLSFDFRVPPLPVQRRIACILSTYDELIENSQRRIKILESMARALYREWFVNFRFPGHENVKHIPSLIGKIPQGWEVKPLESLMIDHIGGGWGKDVPDEDHTEPAWVIRGTDIPDARYSQVADVPHRFHTVSNLRTRRLQTGDILFEVSGGSKGQPVGRALLVTSQLISALGNESVICASFCKRVRPDAAGYGAEILYLSFVEGYESGEIEQFQVQSTGISNFKWTEYIAKTMRVIPPEVLRVRFRDRVAPLFTQIATLGLQIQNLRRTRDLLLPRLLSGQVNINEEVK